MLMMLSVARHGRHGAPEPHSTCPCNSTGRKRALMLVQPLAQHQEIVQPLAVIPHAVTVLTRHGANPSGLEPATIAHALTVRQLVAPGAGRPTGEPRLERDGEAVLGSLEQIGREKAPQERLE